MSLIKKFFRMPLHWQILIGMGLGVIYGVLGANYGWGDFTTRWVTPIGTIFVNLLKLIAVPLVLGSLITGVASLSDLKKLSRIGGKTITVYLLTTFFAVTLGLVLVNAIKPGHYLTTEMRQKLEATYKGTSEKSAEQAQEAKQMGPLQPLVDMIPENIVSAASNNRMMLQVVFFAIFIGIAVVQVGAEKSRYFLGFWEGLNDVIIKSVDNVMLVAPFGVFALIAKTLNVLVADNPAQLLDLFKSLGAYSGTVLLGLVLQTTCVYLVLLKLFTKVKIGELFRALGPAQLLAFSTSSSAATLPVTMERCEQELGISEEITSFVLPLGATINMDGTALFQAVATVFIAQAIGQSLDLSAQLTIVMTAVLASIGTAAVPGAGIIMLIIILESVHVPADGIALILGVDRIIDMCRTVTNVTGDAVTACIISEAEQNR